MSNKTVPRNVRLSDHFQAWELYTHGAHGFKEQPILEEHIPKYKDTLEFAERLRGFMNLIRYQRMGKDNYIEQGLKVTSAYRHRAYNRRVRSSDTSMHTDPTPSTPFAPCAMDLQPDTIKGEGAWKYFTYDEFHEMAELVDKSFPSRPYRLGYYGKSLFVHVDCGYNHAGRRWIGN